MNRTSKRIALCWYPPAKSYLPSPSMTVLKQVLNSAGYDAYIIYWNHLLENLMKKYFLGVTKPLDDDVASLGIFFAYIAIKTNNADALLKQELYLRALKPHYININFDFQKHIRDTVVELEETIIKISHEYNLHNSLFIGMSMSLFQWIPSYVVGSILKALNPSVPIAVGGIGNKEQAQSFIKIFDFIDVSCWGEGESFVLALAECYSEGENFDTLPHSFYRKADGIDCNASHRNNYFNLDLLPFSDFSDFFHSYTGNHHDVMLPIEGARGCHWNRCHFCFLNQGYRYRHKSPKIIHEEIVNNIRHYNVYDFTFLDNDVIGRNSKDFNSLLDELINVKKLYPKFRVMLAEIITRGINYETIKKMYLAGFIHVQVGYESPSDVLLHKIDKKNTFASNLFFIKWAKEFGISVGGMNVLRGLLEEELIDIKEGILNLHYMRFYDIGSRYKHEISSLAVNSASQYYKDISHDDIQKFYSDAVKEMLPNNFVPFEESLNIFQFVRRFQILSWDYFESVESHYAKNKYSYKLVKISEDEVLYTEFYNGASIRTILFNIFSVDWKILQMTDKQILNVSEIQSKLSENQNLVDETIKKLRDIGLLYVGQHSRECVSIINSLKFF